MSYAELERLRLPDPNIDKGIARLVGALNYVGVETHASCEGHLDGSRHRHPWVGFPLYQPEKIQKMQQLVNRFNETHIIKWEVRIPKNENTGSTLLDAIYAQVGYGTLAPRTYKEKFRCCLGEFSGQPIPTGVRGIRKEELRALQLSAQDLALFVFSNRT